MGNPVAYCTAADVSKFGVRGAALTGISSSDIDDTIGAVSKEFESYFRSRYNLPLLDFGDDVRAAVARVVAYELLITRGLNPELGADQNLAVRAEQSRSWGRAVARQEANPDVTPTPPQVPAYDQPRIVTQPQRWTDRKVF
jgi:hypothetical protein